MKINDYFIRFLLSTIFIFLLSDVIVGQNPNYLAGFANGKNAIIKISQGEIKDKFFKIDLYVQWTDKKGKIVKDNESVIVIAKNDLIIAPEGSVICQSFQNIDVDYLVFNKQITLIFKLTKYYSGNDISIEIPIKYSKSLKHANSVKRRIEVAHAIPKSLEIIYKDPYKYFQGESKFSFPDLIVKNEKFFDRDSNNVIDAHETSNMSFDVVNIGTGSAHDVKIRISLINDSISGVDFKSFISLGEIKPDQEKKVNIPLQGEANLQSGIAEFKIEVLEKDGFDAFPLHMKIETQQFYHPLVKVTDAIFKTDFGERIKLNYPVCLRILVQNTGVGKAQDVGVKYGFLNSQYIYPNDTNFINLGQFLPGESKICEFSFNPTRRYRSSEINVKIDISEKWGKYSRDTILTVDINKELLTQRETIIESRKSVIPEVAVITLTSKVDKNIPICLNKYSSRYALIIGNEDYSKYQRGLNSETNVDFARHDATVFKKYVIRTYGVDESNVFLITDATSGEMYQKIDLISKLASKTGPESELIFYYAGHGLPEENSKAQYLIPVDVSGANLSAAIKLDDIYEKLSETGAKRITVFLDACFSGGGRQSGMLASRSVKIKPNVDLPRGNMVVFTASSGKQSALPYNDEHHGIFTYFLLKKIQDTGGNLTYGELSKYLKKTISIQSLKINQKEQDPDVLVSPSIKDYWKSWKIN